MTGITGCDAHAPPRPFPQPVGRLTSSVIDHAAGNLFRTGRIGFIGFAPTLPTEGRSHHPPIGRWAPAVSACPSNERRRGHRTRLSWSWLPTGNPRWAWNRVGRCAGVEPASSVWKTEALTVAPAPRKGNPRTPFFSGFPSGRHGTRTRISTHRGWRAVHYTNAPHGCAS